MKISRSFRNELKPQRVFLHLGKKKTDRHRNLFINVCAPEHTISYIYTLSLPKTHTHTHVIFKKF